MEKLKKPVEEYSLFILRATAIRDIIKDAYALGKTIEWVLRHTPAFRRKAKKDSYKTREMEVTLCELIPNGGIRMRILFGDYDYIRNKIFLTIDKYGDYDIRIFNSSVSELISSRDDILELLLDLINNRNYTYFKSSPIEERAIIIDDNPIVSCIESNKDTDNMYDKLTYDKTKYVSEDTKYDVFIYPDLKAAHVSNGLLLR